MAKKTEISEAEVLTELIVKGMEEKKAHDIVRMDLTKLNSAVTDYFVVCHGDSNRQVEAIARSVEEEVQKLSGEKPWHREGFENAEWILLDYINVVVHVFHREKREFFGIEDLWGDAEFKKF